MTWPALALPYGHDGNYPLPFAFVRTALFSSMRYRGRERPDYMQKTKIACYGRGTVYQLAGEQLDGNDLDVIAGCIRLVYDTGLQAQAITSVQFQEKAFLRQLGWKTGGTQRNALAQSLERMQTAVFEFDSVDLNEGNGVCLQTNLVLSFTKSLDRNRMSYTVTLDGRIASCMRAGWSLIHRSQRNELRENPLAQSLHAFYATHSQPIPLPEEILRPLMRREDMRNDKWLGSLRDALTALQSTTGWECTLSDTGLVTVNKPKRPRSPRKTTALPAPVQSQDDDEI